MIPIDQRAAEATGKRDHERRVEFGRKMVDVPSIDVDVIEPGREALGIDAVQHCGNHQLARDLQVETERPKLEEFFAGKILRPDDRAARAVIVVGES